MTKALVFIMLMLAAGVVVAAVVDIGKVEIADQYVDEALWTCQKLADSTGNPALAVPAACGKWLIRDGLQRYYLDFKYQESRALARQEAASTARSFRNAVSACGDGILDPGEACDDGNTTNGDGCSSACQEK